MVTHESISPPCAPRDRPSRRLGIQRRQARDLHQVSRNSSARPAPERLSVPFVEAIWLALAQIRVQKLKSFFTLLGVTIGVMFLIAVISIVQGMSSYMENDFAAKLLGVNTFTLRRFPWFGDGASSEEEWRPAARPRIYHRSGARRARAAPASRYLSRAETSHHRITLAPTVEAHAETALLRSRVRRPRRAAVPLRTRSGPPVGVIGRGRAILLPRPCSARASSYQDSLP